MSHHSFTGFRARPRIIAFILENSLLLVAGATAALVWANADLTTYKAVSDPLHFWVNDVGMMFFFALAAKEVFEATLPGGALASPRTALFPVTAALGGMAAPAAIYVSLVLLVGPSSLMRGWAIPSATDIAFSAMVARLIFPVAHPAIPFLLLLAIADDAVGLLILATFYPSRTISLLWLVSLTTAAVLFASRLRRSGTRSFWAYLAGPGSLSWAALYFGGIHPALALVPIIPFMPHSRRDLGLYDPRERSRTDTLSRFERWWTPPVQFVLLLFGFTNAGVPLDRIGPGTYFVFASLVVGKPLGVLVGAGLAHVCGATLPDKLRVSDLPLVGVVASIGFTVSLFFATAAFADGAALAETKMGALLSLVAGPFALLIARYQAARTEG